MKAGKFIKLVGECYGIPEATVRVYMRELRQDGFVTQGPSGRGALDMSTRDAARITIALMATTKPSEASRAYVQFSGLTLTPFVWSKPPTNFGFEKNYSPDFEECLMELFNFQNKEFAFVHSVEVSLETKEAKISLRPKGDSEFFNLSFDGNTEEIGEWVPNGRPVAVTIRRFASEGLYRLASALDVDRIRREATLP